MFIFLANIFLSSFIIVCYKIKQFLAKTSLLEVGIVSSLVSPSIPVLGLDSQWIYNQPVFFYVVIGGYLALAIRTKKPFLNVFNWKLILGYVRIPLFLIFSLIFCSLLRHIVNNQEQIFSYPDFINSIIIFVVMILLSNKFFVNFSVKECYTKCSDVLFFAICFNVILATFSYLHIEPIRSIHNLFYNFSYTEDGVTYNLLEQQALSSHFGVFATFSAQNQFGAFSYLMLIIFSFFREKHIITSSKFLLTAIFLLLIAIASESRTTLMFFTLVSIFLIFRFYKVGAIFVAPFLVAAFILIMPYLGERVSFLFGGSSDDFVELTEKQRLFFWLSFFERIQEEKLFIVLGLNSSREGIEFFESGYLNMIVRGGVLSAILYFLTIYKGLKSSQGLIKHYFFIFLILEVIQGTFISFRMNILNGFLVGFVLSLKYKSLYPNANSPHIAID